MKFKFEQRVKVRCPYCQFKIEIDEGEEVSLPAEHREAECGNSDCRKLFYWSIELPRLVTEMSVI